MVQLVVVAATATMAHAMLFCSTIFKLNEVYIKFMTKIEITAEKKDKVKNQMEVKRRTQNKLRIQFFLFNIGNDEERIQDVLFKLLDKYWMGAHWYTYMCEFCVYELSALFIFSFYAPFLNFIPSRHRFQTFQ